MINKYKEGNKNNLLYLGNAIINRNSYFNHTHNTMSNVEKNGIAKEKRKIVRSEARKIVAKVYHFLKEEFEFTELHKEPNCDISHLRNITMRTAAATKVSVRTVQQILKEEREAANKASNVISPKPNQRKKGKIKENIETDPDEDSSESTELKISQED